MIRLFTALLLTTLSIHTQLDANISSALESEELYPTGINIDLREPLFSDGVLSTDKGGVVTGQDLRIQAQKITYTRKTIDGEPVSQVEAEGNLMIEYKGFLFVGDTLVFDLLKQEGVITGARTRIQSWYLSGDEIQLDAEGTFMLINGSVSTCDHLPREWEVQSDMIRVTQEHQLSATNVKFLFIDIPLLWVPKYESKLEAIEESPITYRISLGGSQGIGIRGRYKAWLQKDWAVFARLDYLVKHGFGGGLETEYESKDGKSELQTRNYIAQDMSGLSFAESKRYRLEGHGRTTLDEGRYDVLLKWDKLSDPDMASDYYDRDFDFKSPEETLLSVRRADDNWLANFITRARLNNFQTVKQELPSADITVRPFTWEALGIIAEVEGNAGYIDFQFAKQIPGMTNFNAFRSELQSKIYRPFVFPCVTVIPELGGVGIFYGNSPGGGNQWQGALIGSIEANAHFTRESKGSREILMPYARVQHITTPTIAPATHYVFDINDGLSQMSLVTFGTKHSLLKRRSQIPRRVLVTDVWAHAFLNSSTTACTIPRLYSTILWNPTSILSHSLDAAWDFDRCELDHVNWRTEWTVNEDIALAGEFRHRSDFSWRKADYENFNLDFFRSETALRFSPLSDRRNTVLFHLFYRIDPKTQVEVQSRHGWARMGQRSYDEFDVRLSRRVGCAWQIHLTYEHRVEDNRFSFDFNLLENHPNQSDYRNIGWLR